MHCLLIFLYALLSFRLPNSQVHDFILKFVWFYRNTLWFRISMMVSKLLFLFWLSNKVNVLKRFKYAKAKSISSFHHKLTTMQRAWISKTIPNDEEDTAEDTLQDIFLLFCLCESNEPALELCWYLWVHITNAHYSKIVRDKLNLRKVVNALNSLHTTFLFFICEGNKMLIVAGFWTEYVCMYIYSILNDFKRISHFKLYQRYYQLGEQ